MAGEKLIDVPGLKHFRQSVDKKYITANIAALKRSETLAVGNVRYVDGMASGYVVVCKTAGMTAADAAPEYPATDKTDVTDGTAVLTVRNLLAAGEGGTTSAGNVSYGDSTVQDALDKLLYVAPKITSFGNNVNTVELGSTVDNVNLTWAFNKAMTSVKLDNVDQDVKSTGAALTNLGIKANKTWTLVAGDGQKTDTRTTSVSFKMGAFYGIASANTEDSVTDDFVKGLTRQLADGHISSFKATADAGKYFCYAYPASWGVPTYNIGGFDGGFITIQTFDFTNSSGHTESYNVDMSVQPGLGTQTIVIKH